MAFNYADPYQGQDPYAQQKKQATDAATAQGAAGMDAITRRAAAQGGLNSGAYASAVADNSRNTQAATENAIGGINAQQNQMGAAAQEAQKQRDLQRGEFDQQLGQQQNQFGQQIGQSQQALDLQKSQQAIDQHTNDLNYQLAQHQQENSGGLFGGGGTLGLGGGSLLGNGASGQGLGDVFKNIGSPFGAAGAIASGIKMPW